MGKHTQNNYICSSFEEESSIGNDHIQIFGAGVREGLRRAHEAGNLDPKLISALDSLIIDLRFLLEDAENLREAAERSESNIPRVGGKTRHEVVA